MGKKRYPPVSNHEEVLDDFNQIRPKKEEKMIGKVRRIVEDKGFGFIKSDLNAVDYFFHKSGFDGHWGDLINDVNDKKEVVVEFDVVASAKGPRAENVKRMDNGVIMDVNND